MSTVPTLAHILCNSYYLDAHLTCYIFITIYLFGVEILFLSKFERHIHNISLHNYSKNTAIKFTILIYVRCYIQQFELILDNRSLVQMACYFDISTNEAKKYVI